MASSQHRCVFGTLFFCCSDSLSDCFAQKSVRKLNRKINSCEVDLIAMSSNTIFSRNFKGFAEIGLEIYHGIREVLLIF